MYPHEKPSLMVSLLFPPLTIQFEFLPFQSQLPVTILRQLPLHTLLFGQPLQSLHLYPLRLGLRRFCLGFLALYLQLSRTIVRLPLKTALLGLLLSLPLPFTTLPIGLFLFSTFLGIALGLRKPLK